MTAKSADKQGIWSLKNVSKMYPHSKRHGFVFGRRITRIRITYPVIHSDMNQNTI